MKQREIESRFPFDIGLTLGTLRRGPHDPTTGWGDDGFWRATRTPEGPATVNIEARGTGVRVRAWGSGASWALEAAPGMIGYDDDPAGFRAHHPVVRELHRAFAGLRLGRTGAVVETLVPSIIEQKVTGIEARRSYARLVRRFGEPAPGPAGLTLPPGAEQLASVPYHEFHPLGIERRRADTIRRVCARASRLEEVSSMEPDAARRRLTAIEGVGPWTAAEVARVALGDPDAVSVGDYHLPHVVAWVLAGEARADDARMLALLEPYRGQRARAIRLIELSGSVPPRRGPRAPLRSLEAI